MSEFFSNIQFWHWWVLAIACIVLEVFAPGAVFIWFGASAAVVGLILLALPELTWQMQLIIFSVLSVLSIVGWHMYRKKVPEEDHHPTLNKRGEELIGRTVTLTEPIVNNFGKIRVDDTMWKIQGEDVASGNKVQITAIEGTTLIVKHV